MNKISKPTVKFVEVRGSNWCLKLDDDHSAKHRPQKIDRYC